MLPSLSDRATLLVPVPHEALTLPETLVFGTRTLVRKREHHITLFGFDIGRVLAPVLSEIRATVDELVAAADLTWTPSSRWYLLHRDKPRDLLTVVMLVDAPGIAAFFDACAQTLAPRVPALADETRTPGGAAAFFRPPPPHITCYTSDERGLDGIGLRLPEDIELAQRRAQDGDSSGLRAFLLSPALLPPAPSSPAAPAG
ncbi:MAG: hypothetical protein K1X88_05865 [Nannocystaceae bacterium]|nr:hypothetical protein [Nannocystaceae bacterium]